MDVVRCWTLNVYILRRLAFALSLSSSFSPSPFIHTQSPLLRGPSSFLEFHPLPSPTFPFCFLSFLALSYFIILYQRAHGVMSVPRKHFRSPKKRHAFRCHHHLEYGMNFQVTALFFFSVADWVSSSVLNVFASLIGFINCRPTVLNCVCSYSFNITITNCHRYESSNDIKLLSRVYAAVTAIFWQW